MTLVVDASVAVKWVLLETDSDRARDLIRSDLLVAPDFLILECANVLAQEVRRGRLTGALAEAGLRTIAASGVRLMPTTEHAVAAHRLAIDLGRSAYDSLYLAVALAEGAVLITADQRFAQAARPVHGASLRML